MYDAMKKILAIAFALLWTVPMLFAEIRELVVIQTADTHAALFPEADSGNSDWEHLASVITREINSVGHDKCLLIDCGDFAQGSIVSSLSSGKAGMAPLLELPYDVIVPGNHELDFGLDTYREICEAAGERLLCGNFSVESQPMPAAWKMFEKNGLHVAVIGMQASFFRNWLLPPEFDKCHVEKAVDALRRILPEIMKEKPDVVILGIHQGWLMGQDTRQVNEVDEIASRFPEIDVILGAHTHRNFPGCVIGGNTWYVQPGCHCEYVSMLRIVADNVTHEVVKISSCLKPASEEKISQRMADALDLWQNKVKDELVRKTDIYLAENITSDGKPGQGCQMSEVICMAMCEAVHADAAFHGKLNDASLNAGEITAADMFRVVPYDNRIVTVDLTADELETVMEEQWAQRGSYRYNGPYGALFLRKGANMELIAVNGKKARRDCLYKIAFNSHAAAGSGTAPELQRILEEKKDSVVIYDITTRSALESFLKKNANNIRVANTWISNHY